MSPDSRRDSRNDRSPGEPGAVPAFVNPVAASLQDQMQACMMQRQNLEAIFNSVADGIMAVDLSLRISNLNEAAQQILAYTQQQITGEPFLAALGLDPEADLGVSLSTRRPVDGLKVRATDGRGEPRQLLVSTRVLRDSLGLEQGMVVIIRDVTELESLRGRLQDRTEFTGMVGRSQLMQNLCPRLCELGTEVAKVGAKDVAQHA
jgi:two-component system, NtrC family, sensor histidine kinase AtoS